MNFHRDFRDAELAADLFVQLSPHHEAHDLAFAATQQVITLSQERAAGCLKKRGLAVLQSIRDDSRNPVGLQRLDEEFERAGFHGLNGRADVRTVGHEDDGHFGVLEKL